MTSHADNGVARDVTSPGPKLLFDCTHVFNCSWMNSGIQRVVRNILRNLPPDWNGQACIPVVYNKDRFHKVTHLYPDDEISSTAPARFVARMQDLNDHLWNLHSEMEKASLSLFERARRAVLLLACHAMYRPLLGLKWLRNKLGYDTFKSRTAPITVTKSDSLVLLDSSWHVEGLREHVESLKNQGTGITTIIYDIIPIRCPEFCTKHLVGVFEEWFDWACHCSDGFACISRSVCEDLRQEVERRIGGEEAGGLTYGYFHLGSELDLKVDGRVEDKTLDAVFAGEQPVFLVVGTIEPRKNHGYLLDAFDLLWARGSEAKLCIVGRVGWKCDDFIKRVTAHPELGRKLFMFNSLDDNGLECAYSKASALIFPSFAEGFGLPLVEAMQRGLPAIASDIPVFREVGGDYLSYCDPHKPETCASIVDEFGRSGRLPGAKPLDDWKWIGWKESTTQFLQAISGSRSEAS